MLYFKNGINHACKIIPDYATEEARITVLEYDIARIIDTYGIQENEILLFQDDKLIYGNQDIERIEDNHIITIALDRMQNTKHYHMYSDVEVIKEMLCSYYKNEKFKIIDTWKK